MVFVRSGDSSATGYKAYLNGVLKGQAGSGVWSSGSSLAFGTRADYGGQIFSGELDELRVSNIVRSADWIATEYNNQSNPSAFYSMVWGQVANGSVQTISVASASFSSRSTVSRSAE